MIMGDLYSKYKDIDGFMYINYAENNPFWFIYILLSYVSFVGTILREYYSDKITYNSIDESLIG